jgi:TQXA domain-containing protein/LPXTG-motif cell wall-anchored protein
VKSTDELSQLLTSKGATLNDGLDEKEAIAATQAAVWSFSDNTKLNEENPLPDGSKEAAADVVALYKYLTGADNTGIGEQPGPALALSPTELTGVAGDRIGPFTVQTTGTIDEIKAELPEGVTITDKDGNALDASGIANGTEIYLSTTQGAEGTASFELSASAGLDTGRLFVGQQYGEERGGKTKKTQSLIVAQADKASVTAKASASWTATPTTTTPTTTTPPVETTSPPAPSTPAPENTNGLADTGASVFTPILIGAVLVAAGIGALLFQRKRRRA